METGADVGQAFAKARKGQPLRIVYLGGSITQAGDGWAADWLRQRLPKSQITIVNSGMSATGSALGIFRLDRDVIAYQPDIVFIEFCVNDGGVGDEDVIHYLETIVVRLKKLPHPPAIVMVEAAAKGGVNLARHRRVARHYQLLEVDLQQAIDAQLAQGDVTWETYFSDNVHPNPNGHALYADIIAKTLEPYLTNTTWKTKSSLPSPLSTKPLLLDARMIPLVAYNYGGTWKRESTLSFWWNRFFLGTLSSETPGASLSIPVRGTTFGLFYAMDKSYGSCFVSVDERLPTPLATNSRGGYSYTLPGQNLPPGDHRLQVVLPSKSDNPTTTHINGPVKLGYLLVAGENQSSPYTAERGLYPAEKLAQLHYRTLQPTSWKWSGPYTPEPITTAPKDALDYMEKRFAPEINPVEVLWKPVSPTADPILDFYKLSTSQKPAVAYAVTEIQSLESRQVLLAIACDYFAKIWVNGKLMVTLDKPHGSPKDLMLIPITLKPGSNPLLVKIGAGMNGFNFCAGIWE